MTPNRLVYNVWKHFGSYMDKSWISLREMHLDNIDGTKTISLNSPVTLVKILNDSPYPDMTVDTVCEFKY